VVSFKTSFEAPVGDVVEPVDHVDLVVELDEAAELVGMAGSPVSSLLDLRCVRGDAVVQVDDLRLGLGDLRGESCDPFLDLSSLASVGVPPDGAELVEVLFGLVEAPLSVSEPLLSALLFMDEASNVH
jgi:hypothetical protein